MLKNIFSEKTISSNRIVLRKPTLADAEILFKKYTSDPEVTKYSTWEPHNSVADTENFLKMCLEKWNEGSEFNFIIEEKETSEILGMFKIKPNGTIANVGYVIERNEWNKGYATEVVQAAIDFLFQNTELTAIQSFCDIENTASEKVMIKSGMKFLNKLPAHVFHPNISSEKRDCVLYEIKKEEYAGRVG